MHIADGADNGFNPQARHISNLLTGKFYPVTFRADISFGFFKITEQTGNAVFRVMIR
mgnify:CR=1 FL=1